MGLYHILSISEDALRYIRRSPDISVNLGYALGNAIESLCIGLPIFETSTPIQTLVNQRSVLNCHNAVRSAGDVHSTDTAIFAWSQCELKPLRDLSTEELMQISLLVTTAVRDKQFEAGA